jgi:hypothetical protein
MAGAVRVEGAEQLAALSARLKAAGAVDLRRELYKALNRATKPAKQAAKREALSRLPHRGGLNQLVASSRLSTRTRAGRNPGVTIVAKGSSNISRIDKGKVRHPVYGNRNTWVTQSVPEGWFTDPMRDNADNVRDELENAVQDVAHRLGAL